jgi:hypothetical protein
LLILFRRLECRRDGSLGDVAHALADITHGFAKTFRIETLGFRLPCSPSTAFAHGAGGGGSRATSGGSAGLSHDFVLEIRARQGTGDHTSDHQSETGYQQRVLLDRFDESPAGALAQIRGGLLRGESGLLRCLSSMLCSLGCFARGVLDDIAGPLSSGCDIF